MTFSPAFRLRETQEILQNLSLFSEPEARLIGSDTLSDRWNQNWHVLLVVGLDLKSLGMAKALLEFRHAVGHFPEKPVFSDREIRESQQVIADAAKKGIKVGSYESGYNSPGEAAFYQAWAVALANLPGTSPQEFNRRRNLAAIAWAAYHTVQRHEFLDEETGKR